MNIQPPDKNSDYLKMVVHRGNFSLASLIILAGFQISKVMWITQAHSQGTLMAHLFRIK